MNPGPFPRMHFIVASTLALVLVAFAANPFSTGTERQRPAESRPDAEPRIDDAATTPIRVEPIQPVAAGIPSGPLSNPVTGTPTDPDAPPPTVETAAADALNGDTPVGAVAGSAAGFQVRDAEVRPGDSLSRIFQREGIAARELHELLESKPLGVRLKNIFPGHSLRLTLTDDATLVRLEYSPGPLQTLEFKRVGNTFDGRERIREPERNVEHRHGVIEHSLFVASQRAGLPDSLTMRLAQIFQWDIDFVLDIRRGDEFHVLFEELYVGEERIGYGRILAAEFVNQGEHYQAFLHTDAHGNSNYYNPEGRAMRKAFLRAPVEFSRISSNFNLRRVHPLFKRAMPHRGIDYAAPSGTPILAAGDGRVTTASRTEANGNYVVLQHGEQFVTKYLHLSKFGSGIRSGTRVKQGQVIGYVGATGWATAPHLHYEFLVNGVHQNPRTVRLPDAAPIASEEMARFRQTTVDLATELDRFKQQNQLALAP